MIISITLLLTIFSITSILAFILWLFIKQSNKIINTNIIIFLFVFAIVRLLYPFEFAFTKALPSKMILPIIIDFLKKNIMITQILYFIWVAGILIGSGKLFISYLSLRKWIHHLPNVVDIKIQASLDCILQTYGFKKNPFVLKNANSCAGPLLFGYIHPTIVIPNIELSSDNWHYILQHETSHFYQKHTYFNLFLEILCILYWWNPLFKLIQVQAAKTLEINTDLTITKNFDMHKRIAYLECLYTVAQQKLNHHKKSAFLLPFNEYEESNLQKRFHVITESIETGYYPKKGRVFIYMLLSILLIFASYTIIFEPYYIPNEPFRIENTEMGYKWHPPDKLPTIETL